VNQRQQAPAFPTVAAELREEVERAEKKQTQMEELIVPKNVADAMLPQINTDIASADSGPTMDVPVNLVMSEGSATPLRDLFLSLVAGTKYTMVVHPSVDESVSLPLTLNNVTVREAVNTICEIYEFDCPFTPPNRPDSWGTFKVFPRRLTMRTFKVDFLPMLRTGSSVTKVNAATKDSADGKSSGNEGSSISTSYNSDFWLELERTLRAFLGLPSITRDEKTGQIVEYREKNLDSVRAVSDGLPKVVAADATIGKSVLVNPQAGMVIVRALPKEIQEIENYINTLIQRNQRQVILEAKILEVELNDGFQYGVDWAAIHRDINQKYTGVNGGDPDSIYPTVFTQGAATNQSFTDRVGVFERVGSEGAFRLAVRGFDFISFIHFLESQGRISVLSSPRVSTLNNQKAVIKVGSDEYFITDINVDRQVENGVVLSNLDVNVEPFFSGVALDVTPQIDDTGMVTLHVHPVISEVVEKTKQMNVGGVEMNNPYAYSSTRESDSVIRVRSGEIAIIGGLMKRSLVSEENKVPILANIPVLEGLFGHQGKSWVKSEMVILLRPIVVDSPDSWRNELSAAADRIDGIHHAKTMWWGNPDPLKADYRVRKCCQRKVTMERNPAGKPSTLTDPSAQVADPMPQPLDGVHPVAVPGMALLPEGPNQPQVPIMVYSGGEPVVEQMGQPLPVSAVPELMSSPVAMIQARQ
jgi:MSHA biogenesis protein MshL